MQTALYIVSIICSVLVLIGVIFVHHYILQTLKLQRKINEKEHDLLRLHGESIRALEMIVYGHSVPPDRQDTIQ